MATLEQRTAQAQSKNKALVARVRLAWCEMIVQGGLVFNIAANEGIRAGFNKLLQVDEAYPLKYPEAYCYATNPEVGQKSLRRPDFCCVPKP